MSSYVLYEETPFTGQSIIGAYTGLSEGIEAYERCIKGEKFDHRSLFLSEFKGEDEKVLFGPCMASTTKRRDKTQYCQLARGHKGSHVDQNSANF